MEPKRIAKRIVENLREAADGVRAVDVRIGLGYTAARLEDGRVGLAFTFRDAAGGGCTAFDDGSPLAGRDASQLLALAESDDPIAAAVGIACANALANVARPTHLAGDVLDQLGIRPDDRVGMVGHFCPLVRALRGSVRELTVFEQIDEEEDGILPARRAAEILPDCQVAIVTATSIVNGTIDGLLASAARCREVAIVGASTPLVPEAFAGLNVTLLSGVVGLDPAGILRVVSEGGGTPALGPFLRKVSVRTLR